eukprot:TRINITY_DN11232_c0_g1_i1.p1 TRINITY_DN11232_c0_g1~~TRINITY_DN11232_c0_g1_i1.p1  ORF type:complete len:317 (+),score=27.86 TRINITY_DN11232_c0_g1_i1:15-965(+)
MEQLHEELYCLILGYLSWREVLPCREVCKYWYKLVWGPLGSWKCMKNVPNSDQLIQLLDDKGVLQQAEEIYITHIDLSSPNTKIKECVMTLVKKPRENLKVLSLLNLTFSEEFEALIHNWKNLEVLVVLHLRCHYLCDIDSFLGLKMLKHLHIRSELFTHRSHELLSSLPNLETFVTLPVYNYTGIEPKVIPGKSIRSSSILLQICCGKCGIMMFKDVRCYVISSGTQAHIDFEVRTDEEPIWDNIIVNKFCIKPEKKGQLNCKNDCHKHQWPIDHKSGLIDHQNFEYSIACGKGLAHFYFNEIPDLKHTLLANFV